MPPCSHYVEKIKATVQKSKLSFACPGSLLDSLSVGVTAEDGARSKFLAFHLHGRGEGARISRPRKDFSSDPAARQACQGR